MNLSISANHYESRFLLCARFVFFFWMILASTPSSWNMSPDALQNIKFAYLVSVEKMIFWEAKVTETATRAVT